MIPGKKKKKKDGSFRVEHECGTFIRKIGLDRTNVAYQVEYSAFCGWKMIPDPGQSLPSYSEFGICISPLFFSNGQAWTWI